MANQTLFPSSRSVPAADAVNEAHGAAYARTAAQALAQYAVTGCLTQTYYASAELQLETVLALCDSVSADFVAQTALYSRERGAMKDMPALLCAYLSVRDPALCERVFDRVIDDGKMLRNFVQIVRSGAVARRSLGSLCKRLVQRWFDVRDDDAVFRASVGQAPSLVDVIRMAHPRPKTPSRAALHAYLLGRPYDAEQLPTVVRAFEAYKLDPRGAAPDVPFQLLTSLKLDREAWIGIAKNATWQQTRMNLNTFARHGVFDSGWFGRFSGRKLGKVVAARLRDHDAVRRAKVLPYQLLVAHRTVDARVPSIVKDALEDAMETALENVPAIDGMVYVCCDVSGSMSSPVTGHRSGVTTAVRCIDVAALVAAAMLRKNDCRVLPFEHRVVELSLNARDRVMTNAKKLASIGGGGTSCSVPLAQLNAERARGSLVLYVSDNESWFEPQHRGTAMQSEWARFVARNPDAKLVCIDLQPSRTVQAKAAGNVLDVGGFSDAVFDVVARFCAGRLDTGHWVETIGAVRA